MYPTFLRGGTQTCPLEDIKDPLGPISSSAQIYQHGRQSPSAYTSAAIDFRNSRANRAVLTRTGQRTVLKVETEVLGHTAAENLNNSNQDPIIYDSSPEMRGSVAKGEEYNDEEEDEELFEG